MVLIEKVMLGRVNTYEESREFWLCMALMLRLNLPFQFLEKDIDDWVWFCRAWFMLVEL